MIIKEGRGDLEEPLPQPKNKEASKRLLWSVIFLSVSTWVILFSPGSVYFSVTLFFILMALNEYVTLVQTKKIGLSRPLILILGLITPWAINSRAVAVFLVLAILTLFIVHVRKSDLPQAFVSACVGFFGLIWIAWLFSYVIELRYEFEGPKWVFYTILVAKMGDAGAYFIGKKWGKTKFIPHISPNKTWEGALGQLATSVAISLFSKVYLNVAWSHLWMLGAVLGIAAQIGDMIESMVKRNLEAKDSGNIPGLGGFLDILDSLLFTVPIVYFYVTHLL